LFALSNLGQSLSNSILFHSSPFVIITLQLHYFGHLRKTGGRGSYRLVHTPPHLGRNSPPLSPIILDIRQRMSTLSLPKGSSLVLPFRWFSSIPLSQDPPVVPLTPIILDIRQRMSTLSLPKGASLVLPFRWLSSIPLSQEPPVVPASPMIPAHTRYPGVGRSGHTTPHSNPARLRRRPLQKHEISGCPPVTNHQSLATFLPLSLSSHSTARLLRRTFPERNLLVSPELQGARPLGGYVGLI
jgi:hypothetical protein